MNFSRGFAHFDFIRGQESDNWHSGDPRLIEDQLRKHVREPLNWQRHAGLVNYLLSQRHRQSDDDYSCARVFRAASDWLEDNHTVGPFFLWVDSFDPHEPWDPPKSYADIYFPDYSGKDFITSGAVRTKATGLRKMNSAALRHSTSEKSHLSINGSARYLIR